MGISLYDFTAGLIIGMINDIVNDKIELISEMINGQHILHRYGQGFEENTRYCGQFFTMAVVPRKACECFLRANSLGQIRVELCMPVSAEDSLPKPVSFCHGDTKM